MHPEGSLCLPPSSSSSWPGTRLVISVPGAQESTSHWVRPFEVPYASCPNSTPSSPVLSEPLFPDTFKPFFPLPTDDRMDAYNLSER